MLRVVAVVLVLTSVVVYMLIGVRVILRMNAMCRLSKALGIIICPVCQEDLTQFAGDYFDGRTDNDKWVIVHCGYYTDRNPHQVLRNREIICTTCVKIITREEYESKYR